MRLSMLALVSFVAAGCNSKEPIIPYAYDFNVATRLQKEHRLYSNGGVGGSWECWVPYAELPSQTIWSDLQEPPPVSLETAIEKARKAGNHQVQDLSWAGLSKDTPRKGPPFWKYMVHFGQELPDDACIVLMDGRIFVPDEFYQKK